ncbi:pilus assembly protein PilV, partial [Escherichia coli]|uniref:pilus assembly protein PilV n=1 Tax=Escherichia coli TaxID=562 RepID=UPI00207B3D2F
LAVAVTICTVPPPFFCHVPDWHGGQIQSGTWKKIGAGDSQIVTASATAWRWPGATATCPSGKKVIGGGGQCRSNTGFIWLTRSMPSGNNAWTASCDTTEDQNGSITVYAICQ